MDPLQRVLDELSILVSAPVTVQWQKNSRSAEVIGIDIAGQPWVAKLPGWHALSRFSDIAFANEVDLLNRSTEAFRGCLLRLEVPLSASFRTLTINGWPIHLMPYEGEDGLSIVSREPDKLPFILRDIVDGSRGVLLRGEGDVGLDLRLSNFACKANGQVVYIDIFPPLVKFQGVYFVHFPNPMEAAAIERERERKFTPFGMLRRLRYELLAVDPSWDQVFLAVLDRLGKSCGDDLRAKFLALPDSQLARLTRSGRQDLIAQLPLTAVDDRREIGAKLIPVNSERAKFMETLFSVTSVVGLSSREQAEQIARYEALLAPFL